MRWHPLNQQGLVSNKPFSYSMKKEIRTFFTAVMFFTRLRVPENTDHSQDYLERALKYAPLIGWIVGGLSGLVFLVFNKYVSSDIAILASIIAGILTTGAFHEDGFADTCDAFGGGWKKADIFRIMKDSRLGTYGVVGLISILASKFLLLKELPRFTPDLEHPTVNVFYNYRYFLLILIAAHACSRLMPVLVVRFYMYATDPEGSKSKPIASRKPSVPEIMIASLFALVPFIWVGWYFLLAIVPVLLV